MKKLVFAVFAVALFPMLSYAASINHVWLTVPTGATNIVILKCNTSIGPCSATPLVTLPGTATTWLETNVTEGAHYYRLRATAVGTTQTIESSFYEVTYIAPVMTGGFGTPTATVVP